METKLHGWNFLSQSFAKVYLYQSTHIHAFRICLNRHLVNLQKGWRIIEVLFFNVNFNCTDYKNTIARQWCLPIYLFFSVILHNTSLIFVIFVAGGIWIAHVISCGWMFHFNLYYILFPPFLENMSLFNLRKKIAILWLHLWWNVFWRNVFQINFTLAVTWEVGLQEVNHQQIHTRCHFQHLFSRCLHSCLYAHYPSLMKWISTFLMWLDKTVPIIWSHL